VQSKHKYCFIILALIATLSKTACTRSFEMEAGRLGYEYFPLKNGAFRVYEVEEKVYSLLEPGVSNFQYQLKEEVDGYFINQQNDTTFYINR
jgi:hypothetical protein